MNMLHRSLDRLATVLFVGLLLLGGTAITGCGAAEGPPQNLDEQPGEDNHDEEQVIQLSAAELEEFEITLQTADQGKLAITRTFPGEVNVNEDRFAHIVPRVPGVVRSVRKSVGDRVRAGEVLATLESRELADLQAAYLSSLERRDLAEAVFLRENNLFQKKISSEQEFLEAKQALAEENIDLRSSAQKLLAFGFTEEHIQSLSEQPRGSLIQYTLVAPFDGSVVEKHISQGEALEANVDVFAIADLRTVWVDLSVYQKDLDYIKEGQQVDITSAGGQLRTDGVIKYVGPIVGEETRTTLARIVLDNPEGRWRPGIFVNGTVAVDEIDVQLAVPKEALMEIDGQTVVFVQTDEGFEPAPVREGRRNGTHVEILSGLEAGLRYVAKGGFALKAQLEKGELDEGHAH